MNHYHSAPEHLEEGEKPFWISYSDLMTALMILFLVVMISTLSAVTKQTMPVVEGGIVPLLEEPEKKSKLPTVEQPESIQDQSERLMQVQTMHLCKELEASSDQAGLGVAINCETKTIDLGEGARFESGKWELPEAGRNSLAKIVPLIIQSAQSELGRKWLKRVHIQGFTDTDGSYLYNLNLSLKRSEWVMCQLLSDEGGGRSIELSEAEKRIAKKLFFIGGVSFNNAKESKDASRRVELKLEFNSQQAKSTDISKFDSKEKPEKCQI